MLSAPATGWVVYDNRHHTMIIFAKVPLPVVRLLQLPAVGRQLDPLNGDNAAIHHAAGACAQTDVGHEPYAYWLSSNIPQVPWTRYIRLCSRAVVYELTNWLTADNIYNNTKNMF